MCYGPMGYEHGLSDGDLSSIVSEGVGDGRISGMVGHYTGSVSKR